ncbi:MAG: hypothetical protein HYS26_04550 [Candidatus Kaiserbacteria bacterium]|nr:MAG: hypothetical protein HYS26_04550 [Candidatus Kaiserbacteria bacterium]
MTDEIFFDGTRYISAAEAARTAGFTRDYVARLCKDGRVQGRRIGTNWYVSSDSLDTFVKNQSKQRAERAQDLARQRKEEYRAAWSGSGKTSAASREKSSAYDMQYAASRRFAADSSYRSYHVQSALEKIARSPSVHAHAAHIADIAMKLPTAPLTSAYALTPAMEFVHKLIAVFVAVLFTAGTFAFVDQQYASVAVRSAASNISLIESAREQLAAAANDPGGAMNDFLSGIARAWNERIDSFMYRLVFHDPATSTTLAKASDQNIASDGVRVRVIPRSATSTPSVQGGAALAQTIINQPVIERVIETERIVSVGGITESILESKLNELDNKLVAQIYGITSASSPVASGGVVNMIAVTQRIDNLSSVSITNSTFSGGSISGASISGSSLSISGDVSFGNATSTRLAVTGSATTTFANGIDISDGCFAVDGTCIVGGGGGASLSDANTWTALQLFSAGASSTNFSNFGTAYFGGTATSSFDSAGKLTLTYGSSTAFSATSGYFTTASTSNLTISGAPSSLLSTNSSGGVQAATVGNGLVFTSGTLSTAFGTTSANTWTALQLFSAGASSTNFSNFGTAYFGGTATSSLDASGNLSVGGTLSATGLASFARASTTLLSSYGPSYFGATGTTTIGTTGAITVTAVFANVFPYASSTALSVSGTGYFGTASTTNLTVSGSPSGILKTSSVGLVSVATAGSDYASPSVSNSWSALQLFSSGASTTRLSVFDRAYFGGSATSTFDSSGRLGVLTASPSYPFEVTGGGRFSSFLDAANLVATSSSATSTFAGGITAQTSKFVVQQNSGRVGIGTAAPTTGLDVDVATDISGDLTISGGSSLTFSATGPINQTGTGQVTFAGNVDATNGLDVTTGNFTVGGSSFIVAPATGNTTIAGTLGLTSAFAASSTLQATGASRFYSTLRADGTLTAAGTGTGLSVTNNASIGGTLGVTGAATLSSSLSVGTTLAAATTTLSGELQLNTKKITGVATPSDSGDAANKSYVDSVAQGLDLKDSVRAATTANITLSGEQTVDGVSLVAGDRVLVKNQTDQTKNGLYAVSAGVWTRSEDADTNAEVGSGLFTFISEGTINANSGWVLTTADPITLGTSLLAFTQFSGAGQITAGSGLTKSGNTLDVVGTSNRITVNADSVDISSSYVGQTSITTVGTLTSGALGSGFGAIDIGSSPITGGAATFSSIVGSAITGSGNLTINGTGSFTGNVSVTGTLSAATTTFSGDVAFGGKKITGLADPTSAQEAATKAYVDAIAQGLSVRASVRLATTSNITLSGTQTIDGVSAIAGDRVLVMGQSTASANGIYVVAAGAWSRSSDANENSEVITGMYTFVTEGTAYANTGWSLITPATITLDSTSLSFTQFSGSSEITAGDGLTKSGNTVNAVGTANRISVTADAIDISSTYVGQTSITTVGALTAGSIGSGFSSINIGSSALTAGASTFSSATSYGTLSIGGTATTSIVGNSATSTFSGGITLTGGNLNLASGGAFLINNALALNGTTLGSSVVGSSLTSVGALDSGQITTGFGAINIGADTLDAGATVLSSLTVSGLTTLPRASTTLLSAYGPAYFGSTATTTIDTAGNISGAGTLTVSGLTTLPRASTTLFSSYGPAYFGATATTTIDTTGAITVTSTSANTFPYASTTALSIAGVGYLADGSASSPALAFTNNSNSGIYNSSGSVVISSAGTARLTVGSAITTGGTLSSTNSAGFSLLNASGVTQTTPNIIVSRGDSTTGFAAGVSGNINAIVGGSELTRWTSTGFGVGTTSPFARLSVAGAAGGTAPLFAISSSTSGFATSSVFAIDANGLVGIGTSSPASVFSIGNVANFINSGTSTVYGALQMTAFNLTGSATSTAANGINLNDGCFSVNGSCLGGSVGSGTQGQLPFYQAAGTSLTATSTIFLTTSGNFGVGTTTPSAKMEIAGASSGSTFDNLFLSNLASATSSASRLTFRALDVLGNSTSTAAIASILQQNYGAGQGDLVFSTLQSGSLTEAMRLSSAGYLGVGTTTPFRKLSVADAVSTAQLALAYDAGRYTQFLTDASGDLTIDPSGNDIFLNDDNLWSCTGGSCPSGNPTGTGNIVAENKIGIGTSTPAYKLTIETSDDTSNFLQIASTTNQSLLVFTSDGKLGVGTSSPWAKFTVGAGGAITTVENALTDGATITVNWRDGNQQRVTLGGNRTINFSNYVAGQILRLVVCQDGTGSRTVTWGSVNWQSGTAPTLTTTANKCDLATFIATYATSSATQVFGAAATNF